MGFPNKCKIGVYYVNFSVGVKPMAKRAANPEPVNIYESGRGGVRFSEQGRGNLIG